MQLFELEMPDPFRSWETLRITAKVPKAGLSWRVSNLPVRLDFPVLLPSGVASSPSSSRVHGESGFRGFLVRRREGKQPSFRLGESALPFSPILQHYAG